MADTVDAVVSPRWVAENRGSVVLADVRWYLDGRSGRAAYERGHIPGARFVDLDSDLSAPPRPGHGRHPLPEPEDFADAMGRLGIGDDTVVVAYDDTGGVTAGRLWWMLDVLGHPAAVLDGGIDAWDGALETNDPSWTPARFTAKPWPSGATVSIDEMESLIGSDATVMIDARSEERYAGHPNPVDKRYGHIPGAVNMPATANLASGRLRTADELRADYAALGAEGKEVVAYCGSGVSACLDLLALRQAGLPDGRLFVGSWSAWGGDPNRPLEADL